MGYRPNWKEVKSRNSDDRMRLSIQAMWGKGVILFQQETIRVRSWPDMGEGGEAAFSIRVMKRIRKQGSPSFWIKNIGIMYVIMHLCIFILWRWNFSYWVMIDSGVRLGGWKEEVFYATSKLPFQLMLGEDVAVWTWRVLWALTNTRSENNFGDSFRTWQPQQVGLAVRPKFGHWNTEFYVVRWYRKG